MGGHGRGPGEQQVRSPVGQPDVLVVTTRSRVRRPGAIVPMRFATRRIRRQLARTEGLLSWASVVAAPTEFWTVTVWASRHHMQEFMRSDEHGRYLWRVSRWLGSFWLVRWRIGAEVSGPGGLRRADDQRQHPPPAPADTALADRVLGAIPELRAAMGDDAVASYRDAPPTARSRRRVQGASGLLIAFDVPWWRRRQALTSLRRLAARLEHEHAPFGVAVGTAGRREVRLLAVFTDASTPRRVLDEPWVPATAARSPGFRALELLPESEFGHWDGRRLRTSPRRDVR